MPGTRARIYQTNELASFQNRINLETDITAARGKLEKHCRRIIKLINRLVPSRIFSPKIPVRHFISDYSKPDNSQV